MLSRILTLCPLLLLTACWRPINTEQHPISGNTLALEFTTPVKYVMELKIDGQEIPIRYAHKNRILYVEGLQPGEHSFTVHSISYVFGPEVGKFKVSAEEGAYFFLQGRKYRSSTPKTSDQLSIRAYRKHLKKKGINAKEGVDDGNEGGHKIRAYFKSSRS